MDTADLVVALISQLAAYAEEGVDLVPHIFVCNSIDSLMGMLGPGERVELSRDWIATGNAAPGILKDSAYLCSGVWHIFCGSTDPASAGPHEILFAEGDSDFPIVRVRQTAKNKVQVSTSVGDSIEFRFNDDANAANDGFEAHIDQLATSALSALEGAQDSVRGFLRRVLAQAIEASHGTIIAVIDSNGEFPAELADGIRFDEPIELVERFQVHLDGGRTADTVSRLQSAADLLRGFVGSDGITILDNAGRIRGYRTFVKSTGDAPPSAGGARTRAFEALAAIPVVRGAFFRSQDGSSKFKIIETQHA